MEQRLIDANALIEAIRAYGMDDTTVIAYKIDTFYISKRDIEKLINDAPTIRPKEVPVCKIEIDCAKMEELVNKAVEKVIADGSVVKKEKAENTSMEKCCATCKYETNPIPAEPCFSCIHGLCDENPNRTEKWEAKDGNL